MKTWIFWFSLSSLPVSIFTLWLNLKVEMKYRAEKMKRRREVVFRLLRQSGELPGRIIRRELGDVGLGMSGIMFYRMMMKLVDTGEVEEFWQTYALVPNIVTKTAWFRLPSEAVNVAHI